MDLDAPTGSDPSASSPGIGGVVRAQVRRAVAGDVTAMVAMMEAVAGEGRWIGSELPLDVEERIARFTTALEDADHLSLVVERDQVLVGNLGLGHDGIGHAELGMMLLPEVRGQGLGSALMGEAIAWADAHPVVHKIVLQVWPHNEAARALYRRHGFEEEGRLRRHWRRRNGELWDAIIMGRPVTDRA